MPMPWETWGKDNAPPEQPEKKSGTPWLDWAKGFFNSTPQRPQKAPTSSQQPLGDGLTLDNVFEGLKQEESKGLHIDPKTGGLITSKAGAEGITQLMPSTAKKPGFGIEPVKDKSEAEYLRVGKEYLSALHKKYGNWEMALAAYNAGPKNVDTARGKAERYGGDWREYLPKKEETLPYLEKILGKKSKSAFLTPKDKMYEGTSGEQMLSNAKATAYDIASALPVVGDAISIADAYKGFKEGDKIATALGLAGALPIVPGIIKPKPYFHGTRKAFEKHDEGLIFLTESPYKAGEYASGAGGNRGRAKAAFYTDTETGAIFEQQGDELVQIVGKEKGKRLPADVQELEYMGIYPTESWERTNTGENIRRYYVDTEKTLNLRHRGYDRAGKAVNEGTSVLAELDPKGNRWATEVVRKAKNGDFDWSTTKYPEAQKAWKEILIPQLQKKGYDSIQYWDDMHETLAVFDNKSLKTTLPKKLATADKKAQEESVTNLISYLEKNGKSEEAAKLKGLIK